MISSIFAISRLQRKKLKEILKKSGGNTKAIVRINNQNIIREGKNIFEFIFKPSKISVYAFLHNLGYTTSLDNDNIGKTIDDLYKKMMLQEYSLSLTKPVKPTLIGTLISQGKTESAIVEKYSNILYKYILNNYDELALIQIEQFKVVSKKVASNTRRIVLLIKDNIIQEISQLRSPPNSICQRLLSAA